MLEYPILINLVLSLDTTEFGCFYLYGRYGLCQPGVWSCDVDGLATHLIYNKSADLSSPVTFTCSSNDNNEVLQ